MRLAISYIRFSTGSQLYGDSKRRQTEKTLKFCQKHGLILDTSLRLYDPGKSAFKGKHRKQGALGRFLKLVREGEIKKGTILIVEAFDRLSRELPTTAVEMFLSIINADIDVVTLLDGQWFSKATINSNMGQLFMSVGALWAAYLESSNKSERLASVWQQKRMNAINAGKPMTGICPGWLRLSKDNTCYEAIPERVKLVRLIFWLTLRGWGKQRIAKFFNRHKVPTWGVKGKRSDAWHHSYIQKILNNRAVLGELVPHTTRGDARKPVAEPIKSYYPAVIDEATFLKVQHRGVTARGPRSNSAANLFQGLLRDGENPEYAMWYRNHGGKGDWVYLVSDHRRVNPEAPIFAWPYKPFERLVLNYLSDMDWSVLTASKDAELSQLRKDLETADANISDLKRQISRLVDMAKQAGDVDELAQEITLLKAKREELKVQALNLRHQISAKSGFSVDDTRDLITELAADSKRPESRAKLRAEIQRSIERIELFRQLPAWTFENMKLPAQFGGLRLQDFLRGRCIRIVFRNGAERWVAALQDGKAEVGSRFEGSKLPSARRLIANRDSLGGGHVLVDPALDSSINRRCA